MYIEKQVSAPACLVRVLQTPRRSSFQCGARETPLYAVSSWRMPTAHKQAAEAFPQAPVRTA